MMSDWPGWILVMLSYYIVMKFRKEWNNHLTFTVLFVLTMHHLVAMVNTYLFMIPGADADAHKFNRLAVDWAASGQYRIVFSARFYEQLLGIFYRIFHPSHFFGEELSVIAFLFSCFIFIKLLRLLKLEKYQIGLLVMYGLLPTNLVLCSVTLRESYQILFFMLSLYWGLRFYLERTKYGGVYCIFSAIVMALFHKALIVYLLILMPLLLVWFIWKNPDSKMGKIYFTKKRMLIYGGILFFLIILLFIGTLFRIPGLDPLTSVFSGKALEYVVEYRTRLMFELAPDARANYGIMLDSSSLGTLIKSISLIYFYYLFSPFPWQISNFLDVYAFVEALMRFVLISFSLIYWYKSSGMQRHIWGLLLLVYFSMTFLWSTGTVNYGTSIRHHLLTYWIIVITGGTGLMESLIYFFRPVLQFLKNGTYKKEKSLLS